MLKTKALSVILTALVVSGCQSKQLPISNLSAIKPTFAGASGVDVFAGKRSAGEATPDFRGDQLLEIRSYERKNNGKSDRLQNYEVTGASCHMTGTGFEANFTTPVKVRVPIYGNASSELALRCTLDGYNPVLISRRAYNKTKADRLNQAGSGGLLAVVAVAAINAASDEKKHHYLYRNIDVVFHK